MDMRSMLLFQCSCQTPGCCGRMEVDGHEQAFLKKARWSMSAFSDAGKRGVHADCCLHMHDPRMH
jgi:hypothetical protein